MNRSEAFWIRGRTQQVWRCLALGLGLVVLLAGCQSTPDTAPRSDEFLLVYSGDFRGYFEPCG